MSPRAMLPVTYDYSELLPYLTTEKWCTARFLMQKLDKKLEWVVSRLWVAYNDGIIECKEVINKRDVVVYAWRLIS